MNKLFIKLGAAAATGLLLLQVASPALAFKFNFGVHAQDNDKEGSRPGLLRNFVRGNGRAAIGTGTVTAKTASVPGTLTVTKNGKTYTVNVDAQTQLRRRFWGKATWDEIMVGDMVNVIGRWTDSSQTAINAVLVRDISIQKRFGVFIGTVQSVATSSGQLVIVTKRGTETVNTGSATKFVNRKGQIIALADIKVSDRVRVRGLWNSKLNTITEVTVVKDYSLPTK